MVKLYKQQLKSEADPSVYSDDDASVVHNTVFDVAPKRHQHYNKRDDHLFSKKFAMFWAKNEELHRWSMSESPLLEGSSVLGQALCAYGNRGDTQRYFRTLWSKALPSALEASLPSQCVTPRSMLERSDHEPPGLAEQRSVYVNASLNAVCPSQAVVCRHLRSCSV